MACTGSGDAKGRHCCYVRGEACRFLEENVEGRRFSCSLRRTLGSWEAVHADPQYQEHVQSVWDELDARPNVIPIVNCGTWQAKSGQCCRWEENGD